MGVCLIVVGSDCLPTCLSVCLNVALVEPQYSNLRETAVTSKLNRKTISWEGLHGYSLLYPGLNCYAIGWSINHISLNSSSEKRINFIQELKGKKCKEKCTRLVDKEWKSRNGGRTNLIWDCVVICRYSPSKSIANDHTQAFPS